MKIYRFLISILLSILAVFMFLPVKTLAAESIDLEKDAGLTITESFDGKGLSGVTFNIYLVSVVDETGELTPVDAFQEYAEDLNIRGKNDEAWAAMAETLEQDMMLGRLGDLRPSDSAVTDQNGVAGFPSDDKALTKGLYLVASTHMEENGYVYSTVPFMVCIPEQDLVKNEWAYAVEVKAKPGESPILADFEVVKIWEDECHKEQRPESVTIRLMCDGEAYGEPVTLPHNGSWKYEWKALNVNYNWTVTEEKVEGYKTPEIRREGNTFIVTNVCEKTENTSENKLPQTGQLWWPVPVLIAAGMFLIVVGLIRRR